MDVGSHELAIRLPDDEEDVCRRYGRAKLILNVAELVVLLSVLAGLTLTGASASLLALSHPYDVPAWVGDLSFLVCVGFISRAALFPVQCVNEYWLDRRFGLAWGSFGSWFWEWLSRSALFGLATALILFPVAETLRWWPLLALPWLFAFLLLRPLFFEYVYYPVLARFYPVRFLRNETFTLPGIGKTTLPVYEVQVSHKTRRANATIRLRGRKTAIYVTDTLIEEFTDGEERVVMAHEFGHLYDHLHLEARTRAGVAQAHRKLMLGSLQLVAGALSLLLVH